MIIPYVESVPYFALSFGFTNRQPRLVSYSCMSRANGVASIPVGVRTKRASSNCTRRRASALDTAGCVSPRCRAASVTLRSRSTVSKTRNRLRSSPWTFMIVIHTMHRIDLTNDARTEKNGVSIDVRAVVVL